VADLLLNSTFFGEEISAQLWIGLAAKPADNTHPALAELLDDLVVADGGAYDPDRGLT
jgi:hypothetical protein